MFHCKMALRARNGETALQRRRLIQSICALGMGYPAISPSQEAGASDPPTEGDLLVVAYGARAGEVITPELLEPGKKQELAFPQDPATGVVRNGTRLNQLIVTRVPVESLSEQTRQRAAAGVVAYSGVCSHTGCDVTDWNAEFARFQCPCHESQFDPSDAARVVGGPAPWPLAALPLKLVDGVVTVARAFEGRVGFQQPGLDPFGGIGR
jgi:Rieske Fe-S protein